VEGLSVSELVCLGGEGNPDAGIPEWKDFIKIAGFVRRALNDFADIQSVVLFGMSFGFVKGNRQLP
jgi:hypothetical protein